MSVSSTACLNYLSFQFCISTICALPFPQPITPKLPTYSSQKLIRHTDQAMGERQYTWLHNGCLQLAGSKDRPVFFLIFCTNCEQITVNISPSMIRIPVDHLRHRSCRKLVTWAKANHSVLSLKPKGSSHTPKGSTEEAHQMREGSVWVSVLVGQPYPLGYIRSGWIRVPHCLHSDVWLTRKFPWMRC